MGGTWASGRLVGSLGGERGCGRRGRRGRQAGTSDAGAPTSRIGRGLRRADQPKAGPQEGAEAERSPSGVGRRDSRGLQSRGRGLPVSVSLQSPRRVV